MLAPRLPESLVAVFSASPELPKPLPVDPMPMFKAWFDEARGAAQVPNPDAMSLATVGADGTPSNRIVLCRRIDAQAGYVTFFTNYDGRKGRELAARPRAAACFHWDHADRQVRLEGLVVKSPDAESDEYFRSRRWESRLSAWTSHQSQPTPGREALLAAMGAAIAKLGLDPNELAARGAEVPIPRPPGWGGFRLWVSRCELWLGGTGRLHDRAEWVRDLTPANQGFAAGPWRSTRLQP